MVISIELKKKVRLTKWIDSPPRGQRGEVRTQATKDLSTKVLRGYGIKSSIKMAAAEIHQRGPRSRRNVISQISQVTILISQVTVHHMVKLKGCCEHLCNITSLLVVWNWEWQKKLNFKDARATKHKMGLQKK